MLQCVGCFLIGLLLQEPTASTRPKSTMASRPTRAIPTDQLPSMFPTTTAGMSPGLRPMIPLVTTTAPANPAPTMVQSGTPPAPRQEATAATTPAPPGGVVTPTASAAKQQPSKKAQPGDIVLPALGLVAVLIAGALLFAAFKRWRERDEKADFSVHAELMAYREARDAGEMTEEEYQRVFAKLSGKIKQPPEPPKGETGPPPSKPPAP